MSSASASAAAAAANAAANAPATTEDLARQLLAAWGLGRRGAAIQTPAEAWWTPPRRLTNDERKDAVYGWLEAVAQTEHRSAADFVDYVRTKVQALSPPDNNIADWKSQVDAVILDPEMYGELGQLTGEKPAQSLLGGDSRRRTYRKRKSTRAKRLRSK